MLSCNYHNFWTVKSFLVLQVGPLCFTTDSTLSGNKIWHACFSQEWYFKPKTISPKQKLLTKTEWFLQSTGHIITETGFGMALYASSYCQRMVVFTWIWKITKTKTLVDIKSKQQKMAAALISIILFTMFHNRWKSGWRHTVHYMLETLPTLFVSDQWSIAYPDQIKTYALYSRAIYPFFFFFFFKFWGKFWRVVCSWCQLM